MAALNGRIEVMEYSIARGLDVNCRAWGTPVVNIAVGNGWTPVVECLVRAGTDLDIHEGNSNGTARDMARSLFSNGSHGPGYRRIVELSGLDADAILAERNATPLPTPTIAPNLQLAIDLAIDDAFRRGEGDVRPENLSHASRGRCCAVAFRRAGSGRCRRCTGGSAPQRSSARSSPALRAGGHRRRYSGDAPHQVRFERGGAAQLAGERCVKPWPPIVARNDGGAECLTIVCL